MLLFHDCCDFGLRVPLFCFILLFVKAVGSTKKRRTGCGHHPLVIIIILLFKRNIHSRKNRRFQLRSLHTMHAFPCTPITKDAKTYVLQDCLGDLVLFFHIVVVLGFPCLYFCFIFGCSSKLLGPQKSAALGAGITASHHHHPSI